MSRTVLLDLSERDMRVWCGMDDPRNNPPTEDELDVLWELVRRLVGPCDGSRLRFVVECEQ